MWIIELACVLLLALATFLRSRVPNFREWLKDAPIIFAAAWLGETSSIRLYDFYAYSTDWHGFLDVTPVLIPIIWVFVVLSARDVARALTPKHVVPLGFLIIWFDASLIEPICTFAKLWSWHSPGPFDVPLIGTFGWACFGAAMLYFLENQRRFAVFLAPMAMHVLLLGSWWMLFRWLATPSVELYVALTWIASLALAITLARTSAGAVDRSLVLPRLAPAAFFFALLHAYSGPAILWLYAAAFAGPWLIATRWTRRVRVPETQPAR